MLNISGIENGYVIDHIQAGKSLVIYNLLNLAEYDGLKDIIKIEGLVDIDLNLLGFLDDNITINVIKNGAIIEKRKLTLPEKIIGLAKCRNPRCITSVEQGLKQEFILTDPENKVYRCRYCEEKYEEENR